NNQENTEKSNTNQPYINSISSKNSAPQCLSSNHKEESQTGRSIKDSSFQYITSNMINNEELKPEEKWLVLHCIHTTADQDFENLLNVHPSTINKWHEYLQNKGTIITDVTMVQSGIRKILLEKYNISCHCYLNEDQAFKLSKENDITRSRAAMRLAIENNPNALFAIGNAPTALFELTEQIENNTINPAGIIAAPVGFINVIESKNRIREACENSSTNIPYLIIEGRKGGSNIASTLLNAIITLDEYTAVKYYR
ncbi:MAG: precorrin-8X methylmutase, partial [Flavobacteriales bacterium]